LTNSSSETILYSYPNDIPDYQNDDGNKKKEYAYFIDPMHNTEVEIRLFSDTFFPEIVFQDFLEIKEISK